MSLHKTYWPKPHAVKYLFGQFYFAFAKAKARKVFKIPVVDAGFSWGGDANSQVGVILQFFGRKLYKNERIWILGGRIPGTPLGSANKYSFYFHLNRDIFTRQWMPPLVSLLLASFFEKRMKYSSSDEMCWRPHRGKFWIRHFN